MYGLEDKPGGQFAFDLEKEIKQNPNRGKEILQHVDEMIGEIKGKLRKGANEKDFDLLGTLLHGYASLQKVLKKVK